MRSSRARARVPPTHARYGPTDRYSPAPAAGMCLSVFALVRAGGRTLVGRAADRPEWNDWMPSWRHFDAADLAAIKAGRLFPATYLHEGEDPRAALDRVMRGMLGTERYQASERPRVFSATAGSDWYPGKTHWDLAFVYDVRAAKPASLPAIWRELAWVKRDEVKASEFGWNSDLAKAMRVAR